MCRVQAPRLVPDEEGGAEIEVLHPRGPHGAAFVLPYFSARRGPYLETKGMNARMAGRRLHETLARCGW
jgi:hypothetical protein